VPDQRKMSWWSGTSSRVCLRLCNMLHGCRLSADTDDKVAPALQAAKDRLERSRLEVCICFMCWATLTELMDRISLATLCKHVLNLKS
jgi:hypothetical protein